MNRVTEVATSALAAFCVGVAVWPPWSEALYWSAVADAVGTILTLAVVFAVCAVAGGAAARLGLSLESLTAGGAIAYALGMAGIEATMSPDSPVHFLLYAALLGCFLLGALATSAGVGEAISRRLADG